jgi:signal transduction histidine kinase/ActR/RegA family two-component response regulator
MKTLLQRLATLRFPHLSIRHILLLITAGLTLMIALLAGRELYQNAQRLNRAYDLRDAMTISDRLFDAAENIAVERDLALAMLQADDPYTIEDLRPRLDESRSRADASMAALLGSLESLDAAQLGDLRRSLRSRYEAIRGLRAHVDTALGQPLRRRQPALARRWEWSATELMTDTDALWSRFIRPFTDFDAVATQHLRYRHTLRTITDYTGRERSIIGQILSENADPTLEQTAALLRAQGVLDLSWRNARVLAEQGNLYGTIAPYFTDAASHYATLHDMSREMFYVPGARNGGAYPITPDLWFELSSQASDSLATLVSESRTATGAYTSRLIRATEREITWQIILFVFAFLLCAFSFWMIIGRVIQPINGIINALSRAAKGENVDFAVGPRDDEIGKLSEVLQAFQRNVEEVRRTAEELDRSSTALKTEVGVRRQAEEKAQYQLERLALLHQISRAIGERQDLDSIFQVAVANVEDRLPADFACMCMFDRADNLLVVARVGAKSLPLAERMLMAPGGQVPIDRNGLSKCVSGRLVYEPDLRDLDFPFPERLVSAGLRSFVGAPLQVESNVFGALIVARTEKNAFSSGECEFLRQLSEHIALAAHQAQLNTALKQAYDDLRQTQDAVMQQERLRALGQMASGVAHDINNALSPIALYTESLLLTEAGLTPAGRQKLEIVQRAIDDAARTIARMNDFYRRRDAQLALTPVASDVLLQQVIDLTQARWRDMSQERGATFDVRTEFGADMPPILGVESELREALTNLVFNAIDAMPDGGAITMRTKLKRGPDALGREMLEIEVADTGIGMDEETRIRCLEPFFTTKGERGTGLGLAMVYGVVQRHAGGLEIDSTPSQGTTMRLVLPTTTAASAANATETAMPRARLRLLIVDDDPILLRSLRDVLETDGHVVTPASGGAEGIEAFEAGRASGKPFDAVITDLGMPRIDGRRVAAGIKESSPATPVLLLTGWGERLKAEDEMPPHVDRVLSKPPKLAELRAALALACGADKRTKTA